MDEKLVKVDYAQEILNLNDKIQMKKKKSKKPEKQNIDLNFNKENNSKSNDVQNIYDFIPDDLIKKYHNPFFDDHKMKVPFRGLIVGASGSGKSQIVVYLLSKMKDTFGSVKIFCKSSDEPLYDYLKTKIPSDKLQINEGISKLPSLELAKDKKQYSVNNNNDNNALDPTLQNLVIFDDLVLMKDQSKIEEFFIRARKFGNGVSLLYLTQSYFLTPKVIRCNVNYVFLKKLSSERDLKLILSEYSLGCKKETIENIYKYCCCQNKTDFMLLDLDATIENRFRHNLLEIINPADFNEK